MGEDNTVCPHFIKALSLPSRIPQSKTQALPTDGVKESITSMSLLCVSGRLALSLFCNCDDTDVIVHARLQTANGVITRRCLHQILKDWHALAWCDYRYPVSGNAGIAQRDPAQANGGVSNVHKVNVTWWGDFCKGLGQVQSASKIRQKMEKKTCISFHNKAFRELKWNNSHAR